MKSCMEIKQITSTLESSYKGVCREMFLVFFGDADYFPYRLIKNGFGHVFAIERQSLGWICVDPSRRDLLTIILPACYDSDVAKVLRRDNPTFKILHLRVPMNVKPNYPNLGLMGCVGVMQYFLGIYRPWIITPYQLYRYIIKQKYCLGEL